KSGRGLGVEHASREVIREALKGAQIMTETTEERISTEDLIDAGLIGGPQAKVRRERLGELLKIGYTNGKQLHKRLMMFQITKEDFIEALKCVLQEEKERRVRKECRPRRWRSHEKEKILSGQERR